jgi:hypothetical protein
MGAPFLARSWREKWGALYESTDSYLICTSPAADEEGKSCGARQESKIET